MSRLSILMGSYGTLEKHDNQKHLELAFKSLEAQTFTDFDVNLVSSGTYKPEIKTHLSLRHLHIEEQTHYPMAIHKAFEMSNISSEFVLLMNDDVWLNQDTIAGLVFSNMKTDAIINPISNCCNGRFYLTNHFFPKQQYKLGEIEEANLEYFLRMQYTDTGMMFPSIYHFVPFFCTILRRSTWNKVGGINFNFRTGSDDLEMSLRAQKLGVPALFTMSSYVLHWSGATADVHLKQEDRDFNDKLVQEIMRDQG